MRKLIVIFILFFLGINLGCKKPNDPQFYMVSIGRGNLIVEALEKYKEKNKIYPEDLENLVPNYIENIPKSDIDDLNFIYLVDEKNENYTLVSCQACIDVKYMVYF